jgi:hypothetical protein
MSEGQILVLLGKWPSQVLMLLLILSDVALPPLLVTLVLLLLLLLLTIILMVISPVPLPGCLVHILVLAPHRSTATMKLTRHVLLHHVVVGVLLLLLVHHGFLSTAIRVIELEFVIGHILPLGGRLLSLLTVHASC